jgi:CII-binding regulator of phage lambda lysogenization HflD
MPEHDEMSQEEKIAVLSESMKHLTEGFKDLKKTLERRDKELHAHINRQIGDGITISNAALKSEMIAYTNGKVEKSEGNTKAFIKTSAFLIVLVATITVGIITYINTHSTQTQSTASEMKELLELIIQKTNTNIVVPKTKHVP